LDKAERVFNPKEKQMKKTKYLKNSWSGGREEEIET
jgi:hypothetical protein